MKTTQNNKLAFSKNALVELNDNQMHNVNGGTSPTLPSIFWVTFIDFDQIAQANN